MKEEHIFQAHESYVISLTFTKDSKMLISSGMDNLIRLWEVPNWKMANEFKSHANSVNDISLSPDDNILASSSSDKTIKLWAFPSGELLNTLQDRKKVVSTHVTWWPN